MKNVNKYKSILIEEFYLDANEDIRRAKDGYLGRFSKDDLATFFKDAAGYYAIQIPQGVRRIVKLHEIKWLLVNGEIPDGYEIDHINGNVTDNSIKNLRLVTRKINSRNRKKRSDNTSGITGINWSEHHKHYVIRRTIDDKRVSRSRKTLDEAILVLEELKKMDPTYTQRHGK